jgi:prolyl oligopeptidase
MSNPRAWILPVFLGTACATNVTDDANSPNKGAGDVAADGGVEQGDGRYPATRRGDVVDELHGVSVADPYRWLEDEKDQEVQAWMKAQHDHTRAELDGLAGRDVLRKRLEELSYIDSITPPSHRGKRYFYSRRHADKEKTVYYMRVGEKGEEEVLIDPNTLSDDGSVSVHGIFPSWDGKLLAYKLSENNADAATMYLRNLETGKEMKLDTIEGAKYAGASWLPDNKGFYYTWLPTDASIPASELPGKAEVRFHEVGTDPANDRVVHPATGDPTRFVGASVSRDGRYLVYRSSRGWSASAVYFKDLKAKKPRANESSTASGASKQTVELGFTPLIVSDSNIYRVTPWKKHFYVYTNEGAPKYRVFKVDPRKPAREDWKEIVPESDATLDFIQVVGGRLVLSYSRNAFSEIEVRSLDGKPIRKVELPGMGSASGLIGRPDEDDAYFYYSSFTEVPKIFKTSVKSGKTELWEKIDIPVDTSKFEAKQVWYPSKDGTKVSMFVVHRKGLELDGKNPTLLYGYGGFNVSMSPNFSSRTVVWLEHGGVYAVANLRGGGEYGEEWHADGMLGNKQNVFDDFAAAAEYLIGEKYTSPEKLAIYGGSNGGLLVGAAMTQRPELYRAVVCAVPLLDMVRYHAFGSGRTWISEYGTAEDPKQFEFLHAYSPYHHIDSGTAYPAMLMMSADSDDRVDPMHARKFTAAIQAASSSEHPALLRIEENAGHGGGDMVRKSVESGVDIYSFLLHELGAE